MCPPNGSRFALCKCRDAQMIAFVMFGVACFAGGGVVGACIGFTLGSKRGRRRAREMWLPGHPEFLEPPH